MNRRLKKLLPFSALAIVAGMVAIDHAGAFGYRGDDWKHYDRQSVRAKQIISGDEFTIEDGTTIHLFGVDAPKGQLHWSDEATKYLAARLKDRAVLLKLDGTQTRAADGALLAYVFITNADNLNIDIVRDGQAYSDRRVKPTYFLAVDLAEADARKKHRGMWNELHNDQQPEWRRKWIESLRKK